MKYDLRSYKTTFLHFYSITFVYGPILMKICMNANFIKTQLYMTWNVTYVMEKFCVFSTLGRSDLITTLTYIHMHKYYPCFSLNDQSPRSIHTHSKKYDYVNVSHHNIYIMRSFFNYPHRKPLYKVLAAPVFTTCFSVQVRTRIASTIFTLKP